MVVDLTVSQFAGLVFGASIAGSLVALLLAAVVGEGVRSFLSALWPKKEDE